MSGTKENTMLPLPLRRETSHKQMSSTETPRETKRQMSDKEFKRRTLSPGLGLGEKASQMVRFDLSLKAAGLQYVWSGRGILGWRQGTDKDIVFWGKSW